MIREIRNNDEDEYLNKQTVTGSDFPQFPGYTFELKLDKRALQKLNAVRHQEYKNLKETLSVNSEHEATNNESKPKTNWPTFFNTKNPSCEGLKQCWSYFDKARKAFVTYYQSIGENRQSFKELYQLLDRVSQVDEINHVFFQDLKNLANKIWQMSATHLLPTIHPPLTYKKIMSKEEKQSYELYFELFYYAQELNQSLQKTTEQKPTFRYHFLRV